MTFSTLRLTAFFAAMLWGLQGLPAMAQDVAPAKIGVIEMQKVEANAIAWKDLRGKYEGAKEKVLQELSSIQSGLEEEGKALQQQQAILAPDAFETKRAEFEQRLREENQRAVERRQALDQAWINGRKQIVEAIRNIVLEISEEKGLNLILDQSNSDPTIVLAGSEIKITDAVIQRLDQKIQSVSFSVAPVQ